MYVFMSDSNCIKFTYVQFRFLSVFTFLYLDLFYIGFVFCLYLFYILFGNSLNSSSIK